MNGKGTYWYNNTIIPAGIVYETINVQPGKTYRFHVHNVGIFTCLNFRIQSHNLLLTKTEGAYTMQQNYTNLDIFVGQSYSFFITMDQNASNNYHIVSSAWFVNGSKWDRVVGVAILHYSNSKGKAYGPLLDPPIDVYDKAYSMNQERSIRMDYGEWTDNSRGTYNKWDGVACSTIHVYPGAWTAVMVSLDNVGIWNLHSEDLDSRYLGQETYISVVNPESTNKTELPVPDNVLYCELLKDMQKQQSPHAQGLNSSSLLSSRSNMILALTFVAALLMFL